ncbi:substrate-binding domain-containing protein [Streptomyces sp. NPDC001984]
MFLVALNGASPAHAAAGTPIAGAGSTWAQDPIELWRAGAQVFGYGVVNYNGTGSIDGRNQFRGGTVDFAVSELPYGLAEGGVTDPPPTRPFAYVPVVAGGIAFHYNLRANGKRITNLRLSSATVAGIFTRTITRWDDPAIRADNPGTQLPNLAITPVFRSDVSATTDGLTRWLSTEQPTVWSAYCSAAGRGTGCGATTLFPTVPGDVVLAGSNGVTGYVAQAGNNGAIAYAESSYALTRNTSTAKLLNRAGYYTAPTAGAVAIGLSTAPSDPSGIAGLGAAYTNPDPRTYPLPIVSHLIVPTTTDSRFTTAKGQTLSSFASYALCHQDSASGLGNAPLPPNLVQSGLDTKSRIPGSSLSEVDTSACVASSAAALQHVPQPQACDRVGSQSCDSDAPGGRTESITTTLEPGALAISIADSPQVVLPSPVLDSSGTYLHTSGQMTPITVTDTRPGNIAWSASGQIGDFTGPAGSTIDASSLTWTPAVVDHGNVQTVTAGSPVVPGDGSGLKDPRTLATGIGPGSAVVGAGLDLDAPTSTTPGTYTAVLTLTVI